MATQPNETVYIRNLNERVPLARLKASLREMCEPFGHVVDVVAAKSLRKRGQAFIVFEDVPSAARAIEALQGQEWHLKPMRLSYATEPSDRFVDSETLKARQKARADRAPSAMAQSGSPMDDSVDAPVAKHEEEPAHDLGEPNSVLFLTEIPAELSQADVQTAFAESDGFVEVRMFAAKHVAFVEFASIEAASAAAAAPRSTPVGKIVYAKK